MSFSTLRRLALPLGIAVALAGCGNSGTATPASPAATQSVVGAPGPTVADLARQLAISGRVLYESSYDYQPGVGQVLVFPASLKTHDPNPIRAITQDTVRPNGMFVDTHGDLWVANIPQGAPTTGVFAYHAGSARPFKNLVDQLDYPTEVAVAGDGTVFVNQSRCSNINGLCVTVFKPGSNKAFTTIDLNFSGYAPQAGGMAFDSHGKLNVAESTFKAGVHVFQIDPTTLKFKDLGLKVDADGPGLAVDGFDNIYITGESTGTIDVFKPGQITPFRTLSGGGYDITATKDGTLYVNTYGGINEYAPGAHSPTNSFSSPGNYGLGVAVGPAN